MSSYFIFNSVGSIDEQSLSQLAVTTTLSKNILVSDVDNENQLMYYTPKFLWTLRDFILDIQNAKGQPITPNEYLEKSLVEDKQMEKNNAVRKSIMSFFKDRECIPLIRPIFDERDLQQLNNMPKNKIRPEFTKQVDDLRNKILLKA